MSTRQTLNPHLLKREESILVIIDVQKFLMPVIAEGAKVIANVERLLKSARIMNLPLVVTEQSKLGPTVPEVKGQIAEQHPHFKNYL